MPFGLKDKDIKLIKDVFCQHNKVEEAIIFGSRAMGTDRPGSDIDLAIKGSDITTDDILKIKSELDNLPLAYEFDVVNYHKVKTPEFIEHINKHGVSFYQKEVKPSEWKTYKLSEILNLVSGGTPKTTVPEYWDGDIPWLSVVDFGNDIKRVYKTEKTITEKGLNESSTKILKEGQLIISARGTVGELAVLGRDMAFNQSCYGIYANEKTENNFLYYLLKDSIGKIKKNTHGAVFDTITKQTFDNIEVTIPVNIDEQTQIASILSSLDDKIELNLQMNQTLEAMAQAIFKEWFVNFNFPGFDGELVDGLPLGWRKGKLGEVIELLYGKALKADIRIVGEYPVIGSNGIVDYHNEYLVKAPGIVIGRKGTIGEVIWIDENFFPIDTTFYVNDLLGADGLYFHYFLLKEQEFKKIASDSAVPGLNRNQAMDNEVIIPDLNVIKYFNSIVKSIFLKREDNINQIKTLTNIRDSLLPKLLTGKIEIQA